VNFKSVRATKIAPQGFFNNLVCDPYTNLLSQGVTAMSSDKDFFNNPLRAGLYIILRTMVPR